ncbi:DUF6931 family protein [Arenibaculum pallidiluteum]|uniref:DUF6931 family protein n=1 Tax=Arenibaculum pallidiluteum TaxID=2812559 RepID=UPI001A9665E6|nr:hypothetical protein [Arenibaculum pallidiluteum]
MPAPAEDLRKAAHAGAVQAAALCDLGSEARALLETHASSAEFLHALKARGLVRDAVQFLAQVLPMREGVWWACVCARAALPEDAPAQDRAALEAAQAWVYQPVESNRRAGLERAQATDFRSPASWAAMAAFWSGGSMAPPGLPAVEPRAGLAGMAIASAVILAAVARAPERAEERLALFLESGLDIARGGNGKLRAAEPIREPAR